MFFAGLRSTALATWRLIGISKSTIDDSPQDAVLVPHLKVMDDLANRFMFRLTPHEPSSRSFAMIPITT